MNNNTLNDSLKDRNSLKLLDYEILDYSSYASTYYPENIKTDDSSDPNSRWSTISNDHRQFIILQIEESVIATITFGKFSKIHVCNVKEMKISVSYDNINYEEVFYGGLRNDIESETFNLKTTKDNSFIISKYIKIEPLAAWGMNFNYSIWFVALKGIPEIGNIIQEQKEKTKKILLKDCLRTLRNFGFIEEYKSLKNKIGEDNPILSKVKEMLLEGANSDCDNVCYKVCDRCGRGSNRYGGCVSGCTNESSNGLNHFNKYTNNHKNTDLHNHHCPIEEFVLNLKDEAYQPFIKECGYIAKWEEIEKTTPWPCERGGHQMVTVGNKIYLYGGWNGLEELGDLWVYENDEWKCLISDNSNGDSDNTNSLLPGKRSCHKMTTNGDSIFMIGRYISSITRDTVKNDIWVYKNNWYVLHSKDKNIPPNIYDHYITYGDGQLYCFGGKQTDDDETYGGLYKIYIGDEECDNGDSMNNGGLISNYSDNRVNSMNSDRPIDNTGLSHLIDNTGLSDRPIDNTGLSHLIDNTGLSHLIGTRIDLPMDTRLLQLIDNNRMNQPTDNRINQPTDNRINQPTDNRINQPTDNRMNQPTDNRINQPTDNRINQLIDDNSILSTGYFTSLQRWTTLRDDSNQPSSTPQLRGRLGHTILYIPKDHIPGNIHNHTLVIIGGQRGKENFKQIQFYSINSDTVYETIQFPIKTEGRIIQRAHLYGEDIIILFTFGTDKDSKLDTFALYSYSLTKDKWKEIETIREDRNKDIIRDDRNKDIIRDNIISNTPLPRSAHQFVKYKDNNKNSNVINEDNINYSNDINEFILFGGNVSDKRQNDMWKLTLSRISIEDVKRLLQFTIRKYKVLNLLDKGKKKEAILCLQSQVKPLVGPKEKEQFEKLCGEFFDRQEEGDVFDEISRILGC